MKKDILTPFKMCVLDNFPFIEEDFDAITNYQLLCKIAGAVKELSKAVIEIQEYLKDLDLQDEVNKKLDEMAEDGTLQNLINNALGNIINVKYYGAKGDGVNDDTDAIQTAINNLTDGGILLIPAGEYLITPTNTYTIEGYGSGLAPYYGLLINDKDNITIKCYGELKPVFTTHNMNIIAVTNCNNVAIEGIKSSTNTNNLDDEFIQYKNLIHVNKCYNVRVNNCYSVNSGGCCLFVACDNCIVENSIAERTDAIYKSNALFGSYDSTNIKIDKCTGYGACNDGDISIFGGGNKEVNITNCNIYASYKDAPQVIVGTGFQGICVDSGAENCNIINNYCYGYYYAIDVKTSCEGINVNSNQLEKNKIGIAIRLGEGNAPTLMTNVSNNVINPDGGNGNTEVIGDTNTYTFGMLVQNPYGINIDNNIITNSTKVSGNNDFIGIYYIYNGTDNEAYRENSNITNNLFANTSAQGSTVSTSQKPSIYLVGDSTHKFNNINIVGNTFKYIYATEMSFYDIYGIYLENINISNNLFSSHVASKGFINLVSSNNIKINGNKFNNSGYALVLDSCDYTDISNNYLSNGGGYYPLVELNNCNYIGFKSNYYKREFGSEGIIVKCDTCDSVTAISNVAYTEQATILYNVETASTNLTENYNTIWTYSG